MRGFGEGMQTIWQFSPLRCGTPVSNRVEVGFVPQLVTIYNVSSD
jgi:hypothetical protein